MCPIRMSRLESASRIVLEFIEAFNRHDVEGMMRLTAEGCRLESAAPPPDGLWITGKQALARHWNDCFHDSPQARIEVEEIFGAGTRCVTCWRHARVDPAVRPGPPRGADIYQIINGLITEIRTYVKG